MTFGAAVELSVAMPLSWLPLISDYTRDAKEPVKATAASAVTYGAVSCWMYIIGMGAAIFTGESDIAQIMVKAGLGIAGLLIIVFSTVTTTFLDAYSAGVSSESLSAKINGKYIALAVTVIGTLGAIFLPLADIVDTEAERERLTKELATAENEIKRAQGKLNNAEFVSKAPEKVVNAEKEKLAKFQELAEKLRASISSL
jgi:hypothetical protein